MTRPTFEEARSRYVNRYTMEHVPGWALKPSRPGRWYAPHFRTDREWYAATTFPGEPGYTGRRFCHTENETWPLGTWLAAPLSVASGAG